MAANEATLRIGVETEKAIKSINSFSAATQKSVKKISDNFDVLKTAAVAAVGVFVAGKLANGIKTVTEAAARQEKAVSSLSFAMKRVGEFSQDALADMQDWASALQDATGAGDEATLEMLALAKSFGATNEQAKLVTEAAIEFAAATGKGANEAIEKVAKSLGGMAGELGEINPKIKALTAEQLKAGEAARVLIDQFGGSAAANLNTFEGAVAATQGRFGDFLETLGDLIIKNPAVVGAIKGIGEVFNNLGKAIADNQAELLQFFTDSVNGLRSLVGDFDLSFTSISMTIRETIIPALKAVKGTIEDLADPVQGLSNLVLKVNERPAVRSVKVIQEEMTRLGAAIALANEKGIGLESLQANIAKFQDLQIEINVAASLEASQKQNAEIEKQKKLQEELQQKQIAAQKAEADRAQKIKESTDQYNALFDSVAKGTDSELQAVSRVKDERLKALNEIKDKGILTEEQISKARSAIFNDYITKTAAIEEKKRQERLTKEKENATSIANQATKIATILTTGAQGAKTLLREGAVSAATAAFGPAGAAAGPLFDLLSQGPEATRAMVEEFAQALPEIVNNILEAAPVFVEALAENIGPIVEALAQPDLWLRASIAFGKALVITVPVELAKVIAGSFQVGVLKFQESLTVAATQFNQLVGASGTFLKDQFNAVAGVFQRVADDFTRFIKPFNDLIDRIDSAAKTVSGGGLDISPERVILAPITGGASLLPQIDIPGFASGGEIPAGFPNDTYPARLTSGENVVDRSTNEKLNSFLDNQGTAQLGLLSQILAAVQGGGKPINISLELDQNTLASAIFDLNQRNARLA